MSDSLIHLCGAMIVLRSSSQNVILDLIVIHKFLRLFYDVTCMFSAVKTLTVNLYFKGAWLIHHHLSIAREGQHVALRTMAVNVSGVFDKFWSEYNIYLSCVTILDPRFKVKFVEYCLVNHFGVNKGLKLVANVLATLKSLFDEYKLQFLTSPIVVASPPPSFELSDDELLSDFDSYTPRISSTQSNYHNLSRIWQRAHLDIILSWMFWGIGNKVL